MTPTGPSLPPTRKLNWRSRDLLLLLLLVTAGTTAHLWYLIDDCPLDLSGDEAHYWEWSRRLDLSYYSKGPLVAYIIALGRHLLANWSQQLVGSEELAVRIPAITLAALTSLGLFTLGIQTLRSSRLALAAVALTFTIPILTVGALLMTIDAPLACLYTWALVLITHAFHTNRTWPWLLAGLLIALGILAKYTMVLIFPAVGLTLLLAPAYRNQLRRPAPYLATFVGLLGFLPILVWNAQHDWVSFRHVAGQAGVSDNAGLNPLGPLTYLLGQAAVIGPIWFIVIITALVALLRKPGPTTHETHTSADITFLLCAALTPWTVFLIFSPITKIQPNWPVLAIFPAVLLAIAWLRRRWSHHAPPIRRGARLLVSTGTIVGLASVILLHYTAWLMPLFAWLARNEPPWNLTPVAKYDPTTRLRGWSELGHAVGNHLQTLNTALNASEQTPFILTADYQVASEIAFYCPGEPTVYCLQAALGDRQSQYDLWHNPLDRPADFIGRPCIYVGPRKPALFGSGDFTHVALPGADQPIETVEHRVRGHLLQLWTIYVSPSYAGLPPALRGPQQKY